MPNAPMTKYQESPGFRLWKGHYLDPDVQKPPLGPVIADPLLLEIC